LMTVKAVLPWRRFNHLRSPAIRVPGRATIRGIEADETLRRSKE
jgi:hypothetical protein